MAFTFLVEGGVHKEPNLVGIHEYVPLILDLHISSPEIENIS
jgi:hypothetical protein